jgi:ankyrin repeat protein
VEVAEHLISAGADINYESRRGYSPLLAASGAGHREIIHLLLEAGVDVNSRNFRGFNAFFVAYAAQKNAVLRTLFLKRISQNRNFVYGDGDFSPKK